MLWRLGQGIEYMYAYGLMGRASTKTHILNRYSNKDMGRSLHCQVEHHVWTKFAALILHAIDNFKIYDNFSTYTESLIVSFAYFLEKN